MHLIYLSRSIKDLFEQFLEPFPNSRVRRAALLCGRIVSAGYGPSRQPSRHIENISLWLKENEIPEEGVVSLLLSPYMQKKLLDIPLVSFYDFYDQQVTVAIKDAAYQKAWDFVTRYREKFDNIPYVMIHEIAGVIFYHMALDHVLKDPAVSVLLFESTTALKQIADAHCDEYILYGAALQGPPQKSSILSVLPRYLTPSETTRNILMKSVLRMLLLSLDRFGVSFWRKMPLIFNLYEYTIPLTRQTLRHNTPAVYILISDGPPAINSRSGLALCAALHRRKVPCVVVSNRHQTVLEARKLGVEAVQCGMTPVGIRGAWQYRQSNQRTQAGQAFLHSAEYGTERYWKTIFSETLLSLHAIASAIRHDLRVFFAARSPLLLLSLGESHVLPMIAKEQAGPDVPWFGWNHILTVNTREDAFFPADRHLFYGRHGVDIFTEAGGKPEDADIVGTPTYDSAFHRDKTADTAYAVSLLPKWKTGRHLVVVGTENRIRQDAEVESTLRVLFAMPSVYIVLKLHPEDRPEHYQKMVDRHDPSGERSAVIHKCDLDALLHAADLLITMFSNIIVNASVLGTPSIAYDLHNSRSIDFYAEGLSLLAETPEELRGQICRVLENNGFRKECVERAANNLPRFVGPGDAKSVEHVADIIERQLESAGDAKRQ